MEPHKNNPSESNEHFSVEEMMDRLKKNDQQKRADDRIKDGEIVTRPDGSQVVKVRKRKRRSKQPGKKKKKTNPKIKWIALGSMAALFVILIASTVFIIAKYNGKSFKKKTEAGITDIAQAESTRLTKLRVTPLSAKASKAEITWDKHSFFHSANFSNLVANIKVTSFFSPEWHGEEVVAERGKIVLKKSAVTMETSDTPEDSPYAFETLRCNQLDLQFGTEPNAPAITGLQVSLRKQAGELRQVIFENGLMKIPKWPTLGISAGIMTMDSNDVKIEARLAASKNRKGELVIKGRIAKNTTSPTVLAVTAKNYPIQELLGKELGRIIQGPISSDTGSLSYNYQNKSSEALSFSMPFSASELHISELPMLTDLRNLTGESQYIRPTLTHCKGTITHTLDSVTLNDLDLVGSRLITMNGYISVTSTGELSGELKVGIPARLFSRENPAPPIFSIPHNGNIYTTVTLGGSIHSPHDNLNSLLQAGKSNNSTPTSSDSPIPIEKNIQKASQDAGQKEKDFDELTR